MEYLLHHLFSSIRTITVRSGRIFYLMISYVIANQSKLRFIFLSGMVAAPGVSISVLKKTKSLSNLADGRLLLHVRISLSANFLPKIKKSKKSSSTGA